MTQEEQIAALQAQLAAQERIRDLEAALTHAAQQAPALQREVRAVKPRWGLFDWLVLLITIIVAVVVFGTVAAQHGVALPPVMGWIVATPITTPPAPRHALANQVPANQAPATDQGALADPPDVPPQDYIGEVGAQQRTDADGNVCAPRTGCAAPGSVSPTAAPVVEDAAPPVEQPYTPPVYTGDVAEQHTNADGEICAPRSGCAKPGASGRLPWPNGRP